MLMASTHDGIYVSADKGTNWTRLNSNLQWANDIAALGSDIFAATDRGAYRSRDGGSSWTEVTPQLSPASVRFVGSSCGTIVWGGVDGLYARDDVTGDWNRVSADTLVRDSNSMTGSGSHFIVGTYDHGIVISTDCGSSWTTSNNGLEESPNLNIQVLPETVYGLFAGTVIGLAKSTDAGSLWHIIHRTNQAYDYTGIAAVDGQIFVGTWNHGLLQSSDGGTTWSESFEPSQHIRSLTTVGSRIYVVTPQSGIFRSTDGGMSWEGIFNEESGSTVTSLAGFEGNIIASLHSPDRIIVSPDGGGSWIEVSQGLENIFVHRIYIFGRTIYALTDKGLRKGTMIFK